MGVIAALKAMQILRNVQSVLAIELLCAASGIEYRRPLTAGTALEAVHRLIRSEVPRLESDRILYPDIECITCMVADGRVRSAAHEALGEFQDSTS